MRQLVINADDLGFAPGVNRGILEAHAAGSLSSASMMVNTPAFHEAASLVREQAPRLGVGLHLNLTVGSPLADVPTLADPRTGQFYSLAELARRAAIGRVSQHDVTRECAAQLRALAVDGISCTHIDSHRHSHALPSVLPAVLACAREAGIRIVRRPLDKPNLGDPAASAKMFVLQASWHSALRGARPEDRALVQLSPNFRGITMQGAVDVESRLLAQLDDLPDGATEIMMHPGYDDVVLALQDPYRTEREREVNALCSPAVRERLARGDIELVSFAGIR